MKAIKIIILLHSFVYFYMNISGCSGGAEQNYGHIPPFTLSWAIASGDLNGDGLADLAVGHSGASGAPDSITLWFQDPLMSGNFKKNVLTVTYSPKGITLKDLNEDNKLDIMVVSGANISIYLQDSVINGKFQTEATYKMPSVPDRDILQVGDLNGDGKLDIAAANRKGVYIFFQNPFKPGSFFQNVTILENIGATSLAIEDLNGDGLDDIAISQYLQNKISIYTQDPLSLGSFIFNGDYGTSSSPDYICIADLNGDNEPDIVVTNTKLISIFIQDTNQPGAFIGPTSYSANVNLDNMAIADLNNDGFNDIAVISDLSESMLVFIQDSVFPGTYLQPIGYGLTTPWDITIGDFNNDGGFDIAVACIEIDYIFFKNTANHSKFFLPPFVLENQ